MSERGWTVELPGGHAFFSSRNGGVSRGPYRSLNLGILTDDDRESVIENRRRVADAARVQAEPTCANGLSHRPTTPSRSRAT